MRQVERECNYHNCFILVDTLDILQGACARWNFDECQESKVWNEKDKKFKNKEFTFKLWIVPS